MSGQLERFLLDANVFIEAQRRYYANDICHGFWRALDRAADSDSVCSVRQVKTELKDFDDYVSGWITTEKRKNGFFKDTSDKAVINVYRDLLFWSQQQNYLKSAQDEFAKVADPWLVAYAKANNYTLVTLEVGDLNSKKRIKIPDCCQAFDVRYINTFEMIRRLKVSFSLSR